MREDTITPLTKPWVLAGGFLPAAGSPALAYSLRPSPGSCSLGAKVWMILGAWELSEGETRKIVGAGVPAEIWGGKREQGLGRCFKPARKTGVLDRPEVGENRGTTDGREQKSEGKGTWDLGLGR